LSHRGSAIVSLDPTQAETRRRRKRSGTTVDVSARAGRLAIGDRIMVDSCLFVGGSSGLAERVS
jgi:hypothetical protein